MKFKKIIATIAAMGIVLSLAACGRPGAEINWGSASLAGRVENISGSIVTLTLGVITTETNENQTGTTQSGDAALPNNNGSDADSGTLGHQKPDESGKDTTADNPADAGQSGNTAENSGTGDAGAENSAGTDNTIGEQQDAAGGVSFGDGGAGEDYTAPDATATPESSATGESGMAEGSSAAGRFVAGDTTIRITLNNHGLLSMMGIDGASSSAKLEDLEVGDIVTIDHDSRGGIGGIMLRRDLKNVL